jgi:hypothetical protein
MQTAAAKAAMQHVKNNADVLSTMLLYVIMQLSANAATAVPDIHNVHALYASALHQ